MNIFTAKTKIERNKLYLQYVEAKSPKGSWVKSLLHAFIVGGGICVFGCVGLYLYLRITE